MILIIVTEFSEKLDSIHSKFSDEKKLGTSLRIWGVTLSSTNQSTHAPHLFSTKKKPSVQHTSQFNTSISSTHPSVQYGVTGLKLTIFSCWTEAFAEQKGVLNWAVCWTEGCVKLKGLGVELTVFLMLTWGVCWTEGFFVSNCRLFGVELRGMLNWGFCVCYWRILRA